MRWRIALKPMGWAVFAVAALAIAAFAATAGIDWRAVAGMLGAADTVGLLAIAPALTLSVWVLRAVRWKLTLDLIDRRLPPIDLYLLSSMAIGLAAVTPAQSGELMKAEFARRGAGAPIAESVALFAGERLYDVATLLVLTLAAVAMSGLAGGLPPAVMLAGGAGLVAVAAATVMLARNSPAAANALGPFVRTMSTPSVAAGMAATTLACWLISGAVWRVALGSVGVELTLAATIALMGLVTFANLVNLAPGGVGTTEAGVAGFLLLQGTSPEAAAAGALAIRFLGFVAMALGAAHWAAHRVIRRRGAPA